MLKGYMVRKRFGTPDQVEKHDEKKVEKHDEKKWKNTMKKKWKNTMKKNPDQVEKHDFFGFWWSQQFYQVLKFFHETRLHA